MKDHFETCNVLETGRCTCAANASNDDALQRAYSEGYRHGFDDAMHRQQSLPEYG